MKAVLKHIVITLALLITSNVQAKTMVLIHGFLSDSAHWWKSGFVQPLLRSGWVNGGNYTNSPWGLMVPTGLDTKANVFVTVDLPSKANLQIQEAVLSQYLQQLYLMRQEPITLVGHSAGGLVGRLYAIDPRHQPINGLITIATPHLGTPAANVASLAGNSPVGIMASFAGLDELRDARGLLSDIKEPRPGTFLGWMNQQPHPDIHYASIIRKNESITRQGSFDYIVPPFSQDMNNVWALKSRSGFALSTTSHALNGEDGRIVVEIMQYIK